MTKLLLPDGLSPLGVSLLEEIARERVGHLAREGFSEAHDDEHTCGELALAAGCYAIRAGERFAGERFDMVRCVDGNFVPRGWPWSSAWWKPKTKRRDLVRAASLILAELERLARRGEL